MILVVYILLPFNIKKKKNVFHTLGAAEKLSIPEGIDNETKSLMLTAINDQRVIDSALRIVKTRWSWPVI